MTVAESEERAQFTLAMRAKGINDLDLLRALERAPRALFMPPRFADISGRDIALPIGCGQTSPPPSIIASMIAALAPKPAHVVCEIGTGTGYCTALLAQLAGSVVSLERFQTLAVEAAARIKAFGLTNVTVHWADGFERHSTGERFDRVVIHGLIEPPADAFVRLVNPGGIVVAVVDGPERGEQHIVKLTESEGRACEAKDMGPARAMRPLEHGVARAL
jgi:protein-L-isoaspartate(D-aspartate) O-methyltransferase